MAALGQYFEPDFSIVIRVHITVAHRGIVQARQVRNANPIHMPEENLCVKIWGNWLWLQCTFVLSPR